MNVPNRGERESGLQRPGIDLGKEKRGGERFSLSRWFHHHSVWNLRVGEITLGVVVNRLLPHKGTQHVRLEPRRS